MITESWLNTYIRNGMIDPRGMYSIYRCDRHDRVGGGVLSLVSKHFHYYQISISQQFSLVETNCFEVVTSLDTFRFIMIYRPPEFNAIGRDYTVEFV